MPSITISSGLGALHFKTKQRLQNRESSKILDYFSSYNLKIRIQNWMERLKTFKLKKQYSRSLKHQSQTLVITSYNVRVLKNSHCILSYHERTCMELYNPSILCHDPTFTRIFVKYLPKRAQLCWSRCNVPVLIGWLPLNKTNPPPYQPSWGKTAKAALREVCWECALEKAHAGNCGYTGEEIWIFLEVYTHLPATRSPQGYLKPLFPWCCLWSWNIYGPYVFEIIFYIILNH